QRTHRLTERNDPMTTAPPLANDLIDATPDLGSAVGFGGLSLRAARPAEHDLTSDRARRAVVDWLVAGSAAEHFPYGPVLDSYRTVGKNQVGEGLLGDLRAVQSALGTEHADEERQLLADWLPQVVDGRHGGYREYLGLPVYTSL